MPDFCCSSVTDRCSAHPTHDMRHAALVHSSSFQARCQEHPPLAPMLTRSLSQLAQGRQRQCVAHPALERLCSHTCPCPRQAAPRKPICISDSRQECGYTRDNTIMHQPPWCGTFHHSCAAPPTAYKRKLGQLLSCSSMQALASRAEAMLPPTPAPSPDLALGG